MSRSDDPPLEQTTPPIEEIQKDAGEAETK
jgi:hypothetical protein